jgi:hypothetical protein
MGTLALSLRQHDRATGCGVSGCRGQPFAGGEARAHLENILASLSSGVIVLDPQMHLVAVNAGCQRDSRS